MTEKKFEGAAAIVGKAKSTKKYYFENKNDPGRKIHFFAGDAPRKCMGENINDTCPNMTAKHGDYIKLTEEVAENMRTRGRDMAIMETDVNGHARPSGRTYKKTRFELHEVRE